MTKIEALAVCRSGQRITHRWFSPDEWVEYKDGQFYTEDGCRMGQESGEFWRIRTGGSWETDWSLFVEPVRL